MNIYIAQAGDTLKSISQKKKVKLEVLISLNPHIVGPDLNLAGKHVHLPEIRSPKQIVTGLPICPYTPPLEKEDQWIPLTSLEKMEQTDYDVLIVGTGAGGGAALWRLIQQLGNSGKRIGIVERGGLLIPTHALNIATIDVDRHWKYKQSVAKYPPNYFSPQVHALGGRTLFWGLTSPRMPTSEIARWPVQIKEMDIYYTIAEKVMNVTQKFTSGASLTQILLSRLQNNGYPDAADEPLAVNLEPVNKYGVINSNPAFSSLIFLAQALNHPFDLAIRARVVEVLTENNNAVGVKVLTPEKKTYFLKAKTIILAASTFGTTQILLNSGIQGKAIGHYFANHSRVVAIGKVSRNEFPEVLGPLRILIPGNEDRPYQVQIIGPENFSWVQYLEQPLQEEWGISFFVAGKVESRFDNRVTLDPFKRDEYGIPELKIDFSYSERDKTVIRQMAEGLKQVALTMKTPLVSHNGQPEVCFIPPGQDIHEMGTCRMGEDPATSATNQYGQIHGVKGLYVADNSIIPTSGTANPTLTTVALAIRTADYIAQQLK